MDVAESAVRIPVVTSGDGQFGRMTMLGIVGGKKDGVCVVKCD